MGADAVPEYVGTPGGDVAIHPRGASWRVRTHVGVPHGVALDGWDRFFTARPAARRPRAGAPLHAAADRSVLSGSINPGTVFDQTLPLEQVADGCRPMDERGAIRTLLVP